MIIKYLNLALSYVLSIPDRIRQVDKIDALRATIADQQDEIHTYVADLSRIHRTNDILSQNAQELSAQLYTSYNVQTEQRAKIDRLKTLSGNQEVTILGLFEQADGLRETIAQYEQAIEAHMEERAENQELLIEAARVALGLKEENEKQVALLTRVGTRMFQLATKLVEAGIGVEEGEDGDIYLTFNGDDDDTIIDIPGLIDQAPALN